MVMICNFFSIFARLGMHSRLAMLRSSCEQLVQVRELCTQCWEKPALGTALGSV